MSSISPKSFKLPNLLPMCPFQGRTNPHYESAAAESSAWVLSFGVFKDKKQDFFVSRGSELLCSHAYPYAGHDELRTCCDFVNLLFVVDAVSDDQDGIGARATGEVFLNSMRYPDWDDGSALA